MKDNPQIIFQRLKSILLPYAAPLVVTINEAEHYSLDAPPSVQRKQALFFGAVMVKKNYVSFHLMAVYVFPDLLEAVSPALKKRMQGKSCFNFTSLDETLLIELTGLAQKGFERYRQAGYLPGD